MACIDWQKETYIGIVDCSFLPKSGKATFELDTFWSSCAGKALPGLEVSVLACVGIVSKQTWALDATQAPAKVATGAANGYTRLSFYLEQLSDCLPRLSQLVYWVADGYYAKVQVVDLFLKYNRHLITRLRTDADLHYRWTKGLQPGQKGRTRLYDGKVGFDDL